MSEEFAVRHGAWSDTPRPLALLLQILAVSEADIRKRVANREVVIGFGHAVYTISDPRNEVIKKVARRLSDQAGDQTALHSYLLPDLKKVGITPQVFTVSAGLDETVVDTLLALTGGA